MTNSRQTVCFRVFNRTVRVTRRSVTYNQHLCIYAKLGIFHFAQVCKQRTQYTCHQKRSKMTVKLFKGTRPITISRCPDRKIDNRMCYIYIYLILELGGTGPASTQIASLEAPNAAKHHYASSAHERTQQWSYRPVHSSPLNLHIQQ